jgi:hypothetical protein
VNSLKKLLLQLLLLQEQRFKQPRVQQHQQQVELLLAEVHPVEVAEGHQEMAKERKYLVVQLIEHQESNIEYAL